MEMRTGYVVATAESGGMEHSSIEYTEWKPIPNHISPDVARILEPLTRKSTPVLVEIHFEDGTVNQYRRTA